MQPFCRNQQLGCAHPFCSWHRFYTTNGVHNPTWSIGRGMSGVDIGWYGRVPKTQNCGSFKILIGSFPAKRDPMFRGFCWPLFLRQAFTCLMFSHADHLLWAYQIPSDTIIQAFLGIGKGDISKCIVRMNQVHSLLPGMVATTYEKSWGL